MSKWDEICDRERKEALARIEELERERDAVWNDALRAAAEVAWQIDDDVGVQIASAIMALKRP